MMAFSSVDGGKQEEIFVYFGICRNSTKPIYINIYTLAHVPAELYLFILSSDDMLYVSHDCGI